MVLFGTLLCTLIIFSNVSIPVIELCALFMRFSVSSIKMYNFDWDSLPEGLFDAIANTSKIKIHLVNNKISKISSSSMAGLQNIQRLWMNLSKNELTTIPKAILGLNKLITLVLNENRITSLPPGEFAKHRILKSLFLFGNRLSSIVPNSLPEHLTSLVLSNNLLTHLNGSLR